MNNTKFVKISNSSTEQIYVDNNGKRVVINPGSTQEILGVGMIAIGHMCFADTNFVVDKIIDKTIKYSALLIDSVISFQHVEDNAQIVIRDEVYEHKTGDFGYLYFGIEEKNCKCLLNSCKVLNRNNVLNAQKLIRFGEFYDFPPFSIISAIIKYNKIKKLCYEHNVLDFLKSK